MKKTAFLCAIALILTFLGAMLGCQGMNATQPSNPGTASSTLSVSAASLNFGTVTVGTSKSLTESMTNSGSSSVVVSQVAATGSAFTISGITLPTTLAAGQSYTFSVSFAPSTSGKISGNISIVSDATTPNLSVSLAGTGSANGQLSLTPSSLNFGTVTVGSSANLSATLSASGTSVSISSGTPSNSEFALSGLSFPLTLAAGQSKSFTVTFTPQASGAASGTITFANNASNSSLSQSLAGTGAIAAQHSVSLSWNPSTSVVVGYNIYRGGTSGGPYSKINTALDASTNYTDTNITSGQTYFYVTTAVDGSGNESTFSNQVQAVIP